LKRDPLRRNQFGGILGGPIKRDKLFFFAGFQATRERTAPPDRTAFVPTQAALAGDFSALESGACQSNGKARTIIEPDTGKPFVNSFVTPARFSAPAAALLKFVPTSTDPCGKLLYAIPNPNDENQFISRVDWQQSASRSFFARYFIS